MATVNINVATKEQLSEINDIGPVLADRIIKYRDKAGKFNSVEELKEVRGIGEKMFSRLKEENEILVEEKSGVKKEEQVEELGGMRDNIDLCPALPSCPFYEANYCEGNYEECARYQIIDSALNEDDYLPGSLLPGDKEKAEKILEENLYT